MAAVERAADWPARVAARARSLRRSARGRRGGDLPPPPTFLIVGAQKGGTRWLRFNLDRHPDVFTAETELHYFDSSRHRRGLGWYRAQFRGWSGQRAIGESTPGYTMPRQRPDRTAARIDRGLPGVHLIALLRDPAERVASAFAHHVNEGRLDPSTDLLGYVRANPPEHERFQLVGGGLYAKNLEPYLKRFGDRLLLLLNDDLGVDPGGLYRRALEHVGVDPEFEPDNLERVLFSNSGPRPTRDDRGRPTLSVEERAALIPYFAADIARLEEILDRDLAAWRAKGSA